VGRRSGKDQRLRLLYCPTCQARFSERKGTPRSQARLAEEKGEAVLAHSAEGWGVRKTGRLVGGHRETVARYSGLAGGHAQALPDELGALSPADARSAVRRKAGLRREERKAL
jgi:transposase-like protein